MLNGGGLWGLVTAHLDLFSEVGTLGLVRSCRTCFWGEEIEGDKSLVLVRM